MRNSQHCRRSTLESSNLHQRRSQIQCRDSAVQSYSIGGKFRCLIPTRLHNREMAKIFWETRYMQDKLLEVVEGTHVSRLVGDSRTQLLFPQTGKGAAPDEDLGAEKPGYRDQRLRLIDYKDGNRNSWYVERL